MNPKLARLLSEYAADHTHPKNIATHKLGVPLVLFHIIAMLDWLHIYPSVLIHTAGDGQWALSFGHIFAVAVFGWYMSLSVSLGLWVALASIICFIIAPYTPWSIVIGITAFAWFLQLLGHAVYEKKSPAFLRNLIQILVGPLFFAAVLTGAFKTPLGEDPSF